VRIDLVKGSQTEQVLESWAVCR